MISLHRIWVSAATRLRHDTVVSARPQPSRCINQIDEVCETIEKSINQAVQKTLDQLEKDCNLIISTINHTLEQDRMNVSSNKSNRFNYFLCGVVGIFLPSLFILSFIISTFAPEELDCLVGEGLAKTLYFSTGIVVYLWDWIPEDWQIMFVIIFGALCYFMLFLAKYFARQGSKTLTKREKKQLAEYSDYIQDIVKSKKCGCVCMSGAHVTADGQSSSSLHCDFLRVFHTDVGGHDL
ncbi:uncharacterized protein LOC107677666 [Sinocyclocheilus anshuiensis]|uniref:uncharacterized protein LOC107677666 n=1 Tax=Sinocyclocheilus anshuiensis TaxID=1608454 RepID=UPI0007BA96A4|nr:PREDICTED: uncharacterized protein LOC107677666 [Sinocyclocheilus anshuiensis]